MNEGLKPLSRETMPVEKMSEASLGSESSQMTKSLICVGSIRICTHCVSNEISNLLERWSAKATAVTDTVTKVHRWSIKRKDSKTVTVWWKKCSPLSILMTISGRRTGTKQDRNSKHRMHAEGCPQLWNLGSLERGKMQGKGRGHHCSNCVGHSYAYHLGAIISFLGYFVNLSQSQTQKEGRGRCKSTKPTLLRLHPDHLLANLLR